MPGFRILLTGGESGLFKVVGFLQLVVVGFTCLAAGRRTVQLVFRIGHAEGLVPDGTFHLAGISDADVAVAVVDIAVGVEFLVGAVELGIVCIHGAVALGNLHISSEGDVVLVRGVGLV